MSDDSKGEPIESSPSIGEITMEAYLADMRDEVEAAVAAGLLEITPGLETPRPETADSGKDTERGV